MHDPMSGVSRLAMLCGLAVGLVALSVPQSARAAGWTLVGWNNLGMHCMDDDFAVFSLLPPYNTIHAQLTNPQGVLITDPAAQGISVTYAAVADPDGSINTTSAGKTNFWAHVQDLFGATLPVDAGLAGKAMPGAGNPALPMTYDSAAGWFIAEGIPITPYDDAGHKNYYPMMRLTARNSAGTLLATTDIVLPVSDEMDCKTCHSSGSGPAAQPATGWVFDADARRDVRLNILRLHDEKQAGDPAFQTALVAAGLNPAGLSATVTVDGKAILCAGCHASEALPGSGRPGVRPLTQAIHGLHGSVTDPTNGLALGASDNRSACYRCHPGSVTRCLRGVMGAAVGADGSLSIQCQSCHGSMSTVASAARTGWLEEPTCQACHTGTAVSNNGQIRYSSVFDTGDHMRVAVNSTFATNPDAPAGGLSLYRFSSGHGGIKCEGCHGSTHAEFPAAHRNDNIQSLQHQSHVGMLVECTTCHGQQPNTVSGGPHGMHPLGATWVDRHPDAVESGGAQQCQACHGADYRGTVLSRSKADRLLNTKFGAKSFWRGFQIGCYTCHRGPSSESANSNRAAVAVDAAAATTVDTPVAVTLHASDADGNALALRVVSQPSHGTVGLSGTNATYFPDAGFSGSDSFTFAAWDGATDSNLATVSITVGQAGVTPTMTPSALGTTTPATPVVGTPTPTATASLSCPSSPRSGCRSGGRASLLLRRYATATRNRLIFRLSKAPATSLAELGAPLTTTAYALCLYSGTDLALAASVPPGGICGTRPCWLANPGKGFGYRDRAAVHDGISRIVLTASLIDTSKLEVQGKGVNLHLPPLPLSGPVVAQLINSTGLCFESTFAPDAISRNNESTFRALVHPM